MSPNPNSSNVCPCLKISTGVRIIAILSIFLGIVVALVSSWNVHLILHLGHNPTLRLANDFVHQINTFFQGTTGFYDLDVIYRMILACSGTALACGLLQFVSSFLLFLGSAGSECLIRFWIFLEIIVMLGIGGSFLCLLTNELELNPPLQIFLIFTGLDFVLNIYFIWVVYAFVCHQHDPQEDFVRKNVTRQGIRLPHLGPEDKEVK